MSWYRDGSVNVTNGSTTVTGVGTVFATAGVKPGDLFTLDRSTFYMVDQVVSETEFTIWPAWEGVTAAAAEYALIQNFTSTISSELAQRIGNLSGRWQLRENEMRDWLNGTATGGPNADGRYPLTDLYGASQLVHCPAKFADAMMMAQAIIDGPHTLWHSGNDGAGSGLDADKLDGYHASSFALASSLGTMATQAASAVAVTGGTLDGVTINNSAVNATTLTNQLGGATTLNSYDGVTITHNWGSTDYVVMVIPHGSPGDAGEITVVKASNTVTIYNSGTPRIAADYMIFGSA